MLDIFAPTNQPTNNNNNNNNNNETLMALTVTGRPSSLHSGPKKITRLFTNNFRM